MILHRVLAAASILVALAAPSATADGDVKVRAPQPKAKPKTGPSRLQGIAVATLAYAAGSVEREVEGASGTSSLKPGEFVRTGDRIRTGPESVARLAFPWMSVTASPSTTLHIPSEVILSAVFDQGRAEVAAEGGDILKLRTAEAEIRGAGRVVVRRDSQRQALVVTAREGTFRVEGAGKAVVLLAGEGTVVRQGSPPEPATRLPPAPSDLHPGKDPVYVVKGERRPALLAACGRHPPPRGPASRVGRRAPGAGRGRRTGADDDPLARDLPLARGRAQRARAREPSLGGGPHLRGGEVGRRERGISRSTILTPTGIRSKLVRMRTTLDLPEPLVEEARRLLGFKSKTDTVVVSLQELVRRKRVDELKSMLGRVKLDIDLPKSRRRPRKRS